MASEFIRKTILSRTLFNNIGYQIQKKTSSFRNFVYQDMHDLKKYLFAKQTKLHGEVPILRQEQ